MIRWNKSEKETCKASIFYLNERPTIIKNDYFKKFLNNIETIQGEKEKYEATLLRVCIGNEGARVILTDNEIILYFSIAQFWQKNACIISENPELHTLLKELVQASNTRSHSK